MLLGERETARNLREWRDAEAPVRHAPLPASKKLAGADWRSLGGGGGVGLGEKEGKERREAKEGGRVSMTRTKQRQARGLLCLFFLS